MSSVKINSFDCENVKRVKAVRLTPSPSGLTIIGGRNGQGKTSVLDSIAWSLGGDRMKPTQPHREGSATDPYLKLELSNGLIVERKGKNSSLKVTDPNGNKSGQKLLDQFIETLALDLPRFMNSSNSDKAKTLLQIIGVGDKLFELETQEEKLYNQRQSIGQMERQKRGAAETMDFYPDAPAEPISAMELIQQQQEILARNGENQRKRDAVVEFEQKKKRYAEQLENLYKEKEALETRIETMEADSMKVALDLANASKSAEQLQDESTAEIEQSLAQIEETNKKVNTNTARAMAMKDADELKEQYDELTREIESVRNEKLSLLNNAQLPLDGLSVEKGELLYNGAAWDCMSGSDQLHVATAIVRALKPDCGFVLIDKLEQFDPETLQEFGSWAQSQDLQIIGTRVSTGEECTIVIEDGYSSSQDTAEEPEPTKEVDSPWQM